MIEKYLARIHFNDPPALNELTLMRLHRQHLMHIPFVSPYLGHTHFKALELRAIYKKLVLKKQGGTSFELNTLFGFLLKQLGFKVDYLAARVYEPGRGKPPYFDHLVLHVRVDGQEKLGWLCDVGFGRGFIDPIRFTSFKSCQQGKNYFLKYEQNHYVLSESKGIGLIHEMYCFTLKPYKLKQFEQGLDFHLHSEESCFFHRNYCSIFTPNGYLSFDDGYLRYEIGHKPCFVKLPEETYPAILRQYFGLTSFNENQHSSG